MTFTDPGWPRRTDLDAAHSMDSEAHIALVRTLRDAFMRVHTPT